MDDSINLETRLLSAFIAPFLVVAFVILYFWPHDTGRVFAWPIAPAMTCYLLASAYLGGAYFFIRVLLLRRWHHAAIGFIPIATFATLMLVATILHWDTFRHANVAFWAWISIYAITPGLVLAAWLRNRGADPDVPDAADAVNPRRVRVVMGTMGLVVLAAGLGLFAVPALLVPHWPWHLTTLTARVVGTCFALTGVFGLSIVADARWSAARIALQSQAIGVILILIGTVRGWSDFDHANAFTWLFAGGLAAMLMAILALYLAMEARARTAGAFPSSI